MGAPPDVGEQQQFTAARPVHHGAAAQLRVLLDFLEMNVEGEALQLLYENVERLGDSRLGWILPFDDRFIDSRASGDVVRFDGEQLLQRVRSSVRFQRPDFHFSEALAAELSLATQGLLRDERVRSDR